MHPSTAIIRLSELSPWMGELRLGAVGRASAVGGINGRASSPCRRGEPGGLKVGDGDEGVGGSAVSSHVRWVTWGWGGVGGGVGGRRMAFEGKEWGWGSRAGVGMAMKRLSLTAPSGWVGGRRNLGWVSRKLALSKARRFSKSSRFSKSLRSSEREAAPRTVRALRRGSQDRHRLRAPPPPPPSSAPCAAAWATTAASRWAMASEGWAGGYGLRCRRTQSRVADGSPSSA